MIFFHFLTLLSIFLSFNFYFFIGNVKVNAIPIEEDENPIIKLGRSDLYQGDMIFEDDGTISEISSIGQNGDKYRWPNKTLVYQFDSKFGQNEKRIILNGIKLISSKTCLKFKERKNEKDYVFVRKGGKNSGCNSYVGRIGNQQRLNLEAPDCINAGVVAHEFMHAAGFHHEHCRQDRDNFIEVRFKNVIDEFKFAFDKEKGNYFGTKYDYKSIMHYPRNSFSKNGEATIFIKGNFKGETGNLKEITKADAEGVKKMYKC